MQQHIIQRAAEWGIKASIWAEDVMGDYENAYWAQAYATMAAQLAYIAHPELRDV